MKPSAAPSTFTATVHAADGVRFVAKAKTAESLVAQIIAYILDRCDHVLWPAVARQVRALVDDGQRHTAIGLYFAQVGDRWDEERLELGGLSFGTFGVSPILLADVS